MSRLWLMTKSLKKHAAQMAIPPAHPAMMLRLVMACQLWETG
jgi:hypothetical protein